MFLVFSSVFKNVLFKKKKKISLSHLKLENFVSKRILEVLSEKNCQKRKALIFYFLFYPLEELNKDIYDACLVKKK